MIGVLDEPLLALHEACALLPELGGGRRVRSSTMLRWILDGVGLRNGRQLRLKAVRVGFRWCVTLSALKEFIAARAYQAPTMVPAKIRIRSPVARARACRRAGAMLAEMGM